jgi:hypothetical protein
MEKTSSLIIDTILRHERMTLTELESRATKRGLSLSELYSALEVVHRDKRIVRSVKQGEIVYTKYTHKPAASLSHLTWVRTNYPLMTPDNDGSGIEIELDWLFLKTKEERDAFKAEMTGRPRYTKSKWQRKSQNAR